MKKFGRFFGQSPKNNDICLRRAKALRSEDVVSPSFFFVFPSFPERGLTGENARANAVSGRALSPVKIKFPVATADMRRHSDTLRAANAATKERFTGRKRVKRKRLPVVFPS